MVQRAATKRKVHNAPLTRLCSAGVLFVSVCAYFFSWEACTFATFSSRRTACEQMTLFLLRFCEKCPSRITLGCAFLSKQFTEPVFVLQLFLAVLARVALGSAAAESSAAVRTAPRGHAQDMKQASEKRAPNSFSVVMGGTQ